MHQFSSQHCTATLISLQDTITSTLLLKIVRLLIKFKTSPEFQGSPYHLPQEQKILKLAKTTPDKTETPDYNQQSMRYEAEGKKCFC